ncbi:MAG: DUF4097 domain-containing protein [Coriobacteriaceae bacterium]|jgi:hypothetical protein|nr:DUF4097 domain-containing protein [Coriobacteriaceae bacterium]
MNKKIRPLLVVSAILVIVGGILAGGGLALGGMNPVVLTSKGLLVIEGDGKGLTQVDRHFDKINSVVVDVGLADLTFQEGDSFSLEGAYAAEIASLEISEANGVLTISGNRYPSISLGIGFNPHDRLVFTYPKGTSFEKVTIKNSLGSLNISGLNAKLLEASLNAGSLTGSNASIGTLSIEMDLGSCFFDGLSVKEGARITMNMGGLSLRDASCHDLVVKSNMGSIDFAGLLSGTADLRLDLGGAVLDLENPLETVAYSLETDLGSLEVSGKELRSPAKADADTPTCTLNIKCNLGSVELSAR